ncbi:MAG: OB-fold nucleic acid binding domain protein, partial [Clostridiales bacterium]|nr:OB-fold nucleic acid binding domain protein [Clostridiales bacterium]
QLGRKFKVEGIVTAESVGVGTNNSFFDVIYVQDETGGLTIFGVSSKPIPLGTRIRVTGRVGQYEGDSQIQIKNENLDIEILDSNPNPAQPITMTTGASMLEENEGWLVVIQGQVAGINTTGGDNSLYIDDGSGVAKVYVNGYIGDGTDNPDMLGKWDPNIKVGDMVSAIGLASEDAAGHRIRVRNTAEIIKLPDPTTPVTGITLDKSKLVIKTKGTTRLIPTVLPETATNRELIWTSDDERVAVVDNEGNVRGVSTGIAKITVETVEGQFKASCNVYVTPSGKVVFVTGITLNKNVLTIKPGSRGNLHSSISPRNATFRDVIWTSSDNNIAEVDASGRVTAKRNIGYALITATTRDGAYTAQCRVVVANVIVNGVSFDKSNATMTNTVPMNTLELKPIFKTTPNGAEPILKELELNSSKPAIASVVFDQEGRIIVTAHGPGRAIITAKSIYWNLTAKCVVDVVPVTGVEINKTSVSLVLNSGSNKVQLKANVLPSNAGIKDVEFKSSNENIAVVGLKSGLVTATGIGSATITATSRDGNKRAICIVNVVQTPVTKILMYSGGKPFRSGVLYLNGPKEKVLQVVVLPENATIKDFIVTSSNESAIKVEARKREDGSNTGEILLTIIGRGRSRIMVKSVDGGKYTFSDIIVR